MEAGENLNAEGVEKEDEQTGIANIKYWISCLDAATEAARVSREQARRAWNEYLAGAKKNQAAALDIKTEGQARYPIFWSCVQTMQPAIYSRTPIPIAVKAIEEINDPAANLAAILAERLGRHLLRACPYDRAQYASRDSFIIGGKTSARVRFDSDYDEEGNGDSCIELVPLYEDDYLHTPNARNDSEIDWIAYRALMTKEDVEERFDTENETYSTQIKYSSAKTKEKKEEDTSEGKGQQAQYATIWEIWDKRKKRVYWYGEGCNDKFLDDRPDPYELNGFFPSAPFMLGTCGPDDMYPVPNFIQLEPMLMQLHGMARRLRQLIRASRRKGFADANYPELESLGDDADEGEWIFIKNFAQLLGQGGIEKLVQFFPTREYAQAISELAAQIQLIESKVFELLGIPDILRGVSDPEETAAAQQLKGKFLSLRFSSIQREFQRLNRDELEKMIDLALKMFPDQKLAQIFGVPFMPPEQLQVLPQAVAILKNDQERLIRIDIQTDSTITMNQNAEIEQMNYLAKTLLDGLGAMTKADPVWAPVMAETIIMTIASLQQGKKIEGLLRQAALQAAQPKPEQQDSGAIRAQASIQTATIKAQSDLQKTQMQTATKEKELAIQQQKHTAEAQIEGLRTQLESMKADFEQTMKALEVAHDQKLDKLYLELDAYKVKMDEKEKLLEEMRLRKEQAESGADLD